MVVLQTLVLSAAGRRMTPLGRWLSRPDAAFHDTVTAEGRRAVIEGASVTNWEELRTPMVKIVVERRERAPIIGTAGTRLWVIDREDSSGWGGVGRWGRLDDLRVGETIRVPEWDRTGRPCVSWARVRHIRGAPSPDAIWPGTPKMVGTLRLEAGQFSFASPGGFIHV